LYKKGVVVEVTNLIVPTINDNMTDIREMCKWIVNEVSPDIPVHFARFHPQYKLKHLPPTPVATLKQAREIALKEGLNHVYLGNVREKEGQDTICPKCGKVVVERIGYTVRSFNIKDNKCLFCGNRIYGRWNKYDE